MSNSSVWLAPSLELYGGFLKSLLSDINANGKFTPAQFMQPSQNRSWIPLFNNKGDAYSSAKWRSDDWNCTLDNATEDILIFKVTFTPVGFGTFHLLNQLTTNDWQHWRFHGDLDENVLSQEGFKLFSIDPHLWHIQVSAFSLTLQTLGASFVCGCDCAGSNRISLTLMYR